MKTLDIERFRSIVDFAGLLIVLLLISDLFFAAPVTEILLALTSLSTLAFTVHIFRKGHNI